MGQGTYKVGEVIEVTYQAKGSTTGLTDVVMEIYDETGAKDIPIFPDVIMTEVGSTGRYYGVFTPDVVGVWKVLIDSATASGKMVKQFDVVLHNIDSIGGAVDSVKSTVEGITSRPLLG
ncbi:hypothetical protein LCGC14_0355680 [marine sediment metagenome]|uniref:YtkA-like domain-containing protein n=1 Tax=marine sediment metagenome TaxID=412755 RepID=A0A0F9VWK7_9ZZZZ